MTLFLTSTINTYYKDENGNKIAIPVEDENLILTNLKKFLKKKNRLVYVANDPNNIEKNESRIKVLCESFDKSGLKFKEKILLDSRNKHKAKEILSGADLVILSGGKCLRQLEFFNEINLKEIIKEHNLLTIGISAGSMNLCNIVANFPEETSDLGEPLWVNGLGFYDGIFIPHFDGETKTYQIEDVEIDVVNDYVLPLSKEKELIGVPNGSYILINDNKVSYYGKIYKILNGKIKILRQKNEKEF